MFKAKLKHKIMAKQKDDLNTLLQCPLYWLLELSLYHFILILYASKTGLATLITLMYSNCLNQCFTAKSKHIYIHDFTNIHRTQGAIYLIARFE